MSEGRPDPLARFLGHAVVGGIALYVFGRRFAGSALLASLLTVAAHEMLDAPVAKKLSEFGL